MKVLKGYVNWMEGRENRPNMYLLVDKIPALDAMRFRLHDKGGTINGGLYFAENDGYCRFFSHYSNTPDGNGGGFGGRSFDLTMIDGTPKTLRGPWSSNAGEMNERGFGPCTEAYLTMDADAFARGHAFTHGAVLLSKLREAADRIAVGTGYTWRPGAMYASEVTFPTGSRFALACNGHVTTAHREGREQKFVARPEVFPDGALIENIREALQAALALDGHTRRSPWDQAASGSKLVGHELAYEIGERYRRHVPYEPIDTLLSLSSYEAAVQFPDGEYWVKPATT